MCAYKTDAWFNYSRIQRDPALIAYSPEHDGRHEVERQTTFHDGTNEANPPFIRHRVSWRDDVGCRHWVRYDLLVEPLSGLNTKDQNEDIGVDVEEVY